MFRDNPQAYSFVEILNKITFFGAEVLNVRGSHYKLRIPCLTDKTCSKVCIVVRPHGKGKKTSKLSKGSASYFIRPLEEAGYLPVAIKQQSHAKKQRRRRKKKPK